MMAHSRVWQQSSSFVSFFRAAGGSAVSFLFVCRNLPARTAALYSTTSMSSATNREIEIKLRVGDPALLERKLRRIGATPRGRVFEQNTIYDTADCAFRRIGRLLRLRLETPAPRRAAVQGPPLVRPDLRPGRAVITAKAPPHSGGRRSTHARYKERLEREVVIRSPGRSRRALGSLGLRPSFTYEKFRSTFDLPGLHLDLDQTPVGTFLELEGSPEAIDRAARALGFTPRDYFRGTYWDVYAADCGRRSRPLRNMVFPRKNRVKTSLFA
jgi:adenylate cyclase class 2